MLYDIFRVSDFTRSFYLFVVVMLLPCQDAIAASRDDARGAAQGEALVQVYELPQGMRLRVPVGYLWRSELPPDSGVRDKSQTGSKIYFHAIAPDLKPPAYDYLKNWKGGNGYPPYLSFNIAVSLPDVTEGYQEKFMRKSMAAGTCNAKKIGDRCEDPTALWPGRWETFYLGEGHQFVRCDQDGSVPAPHCDTSMLLMDRFFVDLRFDRRILDFDDPTWDRIYRLVCSWIEWPESVSLNVNRCR
ncbi:MAG: hypothetical protein RIC50_04035 [Rhodospirillales bacterium]